MAQKSVKTLIGIIIFPILCLLFSLLILRTDPEFTLLLLKNPEAAAPTKQLLNYFENNAEIPNIFTEQEKSHLTDVKKLLNSAYYAFGILAAILIYCAQNNWKPVVKKGTILLIIILAILFFIPFDAFFTRFHQILFPQGNWQFSPDSTLIQFYPETFFISYGIAIAIHALVAAFFLNYLEIVSRKG